MSANNARRTGRQRGTTLVEVAILFGGFVLLVFATLELARAVYIYNTLQEVTRRAAAELALTAPADPDSGGILAVRRRAIFEGKDDALVMAAPVTVAHVRVDYMALTRDNDGSMRRVPVVALPPCANSARRICMANPNAPDCVRFVRVRICAPGAPGECEPVGYRTALPLLTFGSMLPRATTIATVESLGFVPNTNAVCL